MEQRRTRRFKLQLPLSITRAGAERVTLAGRTDNISSSGVLFTTQGEPEVGGPIEYIITLTSDGSQPVNLRCIGKILRSETAHGHGDFSRECQIAATLERYEFVREH